MESSEERKESGEELEKLQENVGNLEQRCCQIMEENKGLKEKLERSTETVVGLEEEKATQEAKISVMRKTVQELREEEEKFKRDLAVKLNLLKEKLNEKDELTRRKMNRKLEKGDGDFVMERKSEIELLEELEGRVHIVREVPFDRKIVEKVLQEETKNARILKFVLLLLGFPTVFFPPLALFFVDFLLFNYKRDGFSFQKNVDRIFKDKGVVIASLLTCCFYIPGFLFAVAIHIYVLIVSVGSFRKRKKTR